jgi:hypothetical protein
MKMVCYYLPTSLIDTACTFLLRSATTDDPFGGDGMASSFEEYGGAQAI